MHIYIHNVYIYININIRTGFFQTHTHTHAALDTRSRVTKTDPPGAHGANGCDESEEGEECAGAGTSTGVLFTRQPVPEKFTHKTTAWDSMCFHIFVYIYIIYLHTYIYIYTWMRMHVSMYDVYVYIYIYVHMDIQRICWCLHVFLPTKLGIQQRHMAFRMGVENEVSCSKGSAAAGAACCVLLRSSPLVMFKDIPQRNPG